MTISQATEQLRDAQARLLPRMTEDKLADSVRTTARDLVNEIGVKAGRIASNDRDMIEFWSSAIAHDARGVEQLSRLPVLPEFQVQKIRAAVNEIKTRDACSEDVAFARARIEQPALFVER